MDIIKPSVSLPTHHTARLLGHCSLHRGVGINRTHRTISGSTWSGKRMSFNQFLNGLGRWGATKSANLTVVQWLRICLAMQGCGFGPWVGNYDSTRCGEAKPICNYWASVFWSLRDTWRGHVPQLKISQDATKTRYNHINTQKKKKKIRPDLRNPVTFTQSPCPCSCAWTEVHRPLTEPSHGGEGSISDGSALWCQDGNSGHSFINIRDLTNRLRSVSEC